MRKIILIIATIVALTSCKKDEVYPIVITGGNTSNVPTIMPDKYISSYPYLTINYDSLNNHWPVSQNMIFDFDNNGRYDLITVRHNSSFANNVVKYELLTPYVVMDDGTIKEIPNLWKGGTEMTNGDYNGDGYNDIAVFDDGPEYWNINPNPPKTPVVVYWNSKYGFTGESTKVCEVYQNSFCLVSTKLNNSKKDILILGQPGSDTYWQFDGTTFNNVSFNNVSDIKGFTMNNHLYDDFDNDGKIYSTTKGTDV